MSEELSLMAETEDQIDSEPKLGENGNPEGSDQPQPSNRASGKSEAWEWIKALLIALVLVVLIRWLLFAPFIVDGPSMQPNFHTGERLIVNKIIYRMRPPERGEVIVFHAPAQKEYIKRVIALPGEKVKVEGDKVFIDGTLLDEPYLAEAIANAAARGESYNHNGYDEQTVPPDSLFVMGDNRPQSLDSRYPSVGFVPYSEIVGRADIIFWPIGDISLIR
jgi:signal peptidase I